jgi:hypothetical protein
MSLDAIHPNTYELTELLWHMNLKKLDIILKTLVQLLYYDMQYIK